MHERLKNGRLARARPMRGIEGVGLLEDSFSICWHSNYIRFTAALPSNWEIDHDMSPMQACTTLNWSPAEAQLMSIGQTTGANPRRCHQGRIR